MHLFCYNGYMHKETMNNVVLRVAAKGVVVREDGRVLILREAVYDEGTNEGRWGLPGGRLDIGETYIEGLRREVKEETGLTIEPGKPVYVGEWHPVIKGVPHQIIAVFSECHCSSDEVRLSDEHDAYRWIEVADIEGINFMVPDDEVLRSFFSG